MVPGDDRLELGAGERARDRLAEDIPLAAGRVVHEAIRPRPKVSVWPFTCGSNTAVAPTSGDSAMEAVSSTGVVPGLNRTTTGGRRLRPSSPSPLRPASPVPELWARSRRWRLRGEEE